jgi:hypothetical protein
VDQSSCPYYFETSKEAVWASLSLSLPKPSQTHRARWQLSTCEVRGGIIDSGNKPAYTLKLQRLRQLCPKLSPTTALNLRGLYSGGMSDSRERWADIWELQSLRFGSCLSCHHVLCLGWPRFHATYNNLMRLCPFCNEEMKK